MKRTVFEQKPLTHVSHKTSSDKFPDVIVAFPTIEHGLRLLQEPVIAGLSNAQSDGEESLDAGDYERCRSGVAIAPSPFSSSIFLRTKQ